MYAERLSLSMSANRWVALEIDVPAAGTYRVSMEYYISNETKQNDSTGVYFIPMTAPAYIDAALVAESLLGTLNFKDVKLSGAETRVTGEGGIAALANVE